MDSGKMSPRTQRAMLGMKAHGDKPLTLKWVYGFAAMVTALKVAGFITPFDRISALETSVKSLQDKMEKVATKEDLQNFLNSIRVVKGGGQ